jgi:hypothetical protein
MSMSLRHWAIKYARAGFRVLPLEPGGKSPLGSSKDSPFHSDRRRPVHGFKDATTDEDQIKTWWTIWPDANIGICPPDDVAIVDIDPRNGGKRLPKMMPTLESKSGRGDGGGHLFYKSAPDYLPGELAPGIDVIMGNRYVVAPPSIHPDTGHAYEWVGKFDPARIQPWPKGLVRHADKPAAPKLNGAHLPLSPSQVAWCLERISADYEPTWVEIGMALKADWGDEGFPWWLEWSPTTTRNNFPGEAACRKKWDGFKGSGLTTRTLKFIAEEASGETMPLHTYVEAAEDFGDEVETDILDTERTRSALSKTKRGKSAAIPVLDVDTFMKRPRPRWRVKNLLPETGVALIYGPTGSGKTFLSLDLVASIIGGVCWGRSELIVRRGRVMYVAAEGPGGFRNRVEALKKEDRDMSGLFVIPVAPQITSDQLVDDLIRAIREVGGTDVIVLDTLSQVTSGIDENSSEMGAAIRAAARLREAFNCLVVFIGHTGKEQSKGHRGWSGVIAAVDTAIEVVASNSIRTATVTKQRDGESGMEYSFVLRSVPLGRDDDGDLITTCVLDYRDAPPATTKVNKPKGHNQTIVYDAIREAITADGIAAESEIITKMAAQLPRGSGRDKRRQYVRQAIEGLVERNLVIHEKEALRLMP